MVLMSAIPRCPRRVYLPDVPRFISSRVKHPHQRTCFGFIHLLFLSLSWIINTSALLSGWRSMANGAFGERIRMDCDETSDAASARGWTACRGELRRLTRPGGSRLRYCTAGTGPPPVPLHAVRTQLDPFRDGHERFAETSRDSMAGGPAMPKCRHRATMIYSEHLPPRADPTTWHRSAPDPDSRTTLRRSSPIHSREVFSRG